MIKEIMRIRAERIGIEGPAAIRNRDSELMFLVALALKRNETAVVRLAELFNRPRNRYQGWRLVVVAVEGSEGPVQTGDGGRGSKTWADCTLRPFAGKPRWPQTRREC